MDHRMERAEAMFTGTAKSKVVAEICFDENETVKVRNINHRILPTQIVFSTNSLVTRLYILQSAERSLSDQYGIFL